MPTCENCCVSPGKLVLQYAHGPFMNGTFERHPKLIGRARMKEIVNEALEALKK